MPAHGSIDHSAETPTQTLARIQLIQLEVNGLLNKARGCQDLEQVRAIRAEMEVRLESLREIRRQQLMRQINPPKTRPWWRFW